MAHFWKLIGDVGHWGKLESGDFENAPCPFPDSGDVGQLLAKTADECGAEWVDAPIGIPTGGTTGQVLKKDSNTDYDVSWEDDNTGGAGIPSGGTTGQVLKKDSNTDYDVSWQDDEEGIPDAPTDGEIYGRKDGNWEIITHPLATFEQSRWSFTDMFSTSNAASFVPYIGAAISSGTITAIPAALKSGLHQGGITISSSTSANSGYSVLTDITALIGASGLITRCIFAPRASEADRTVRIGFLDTTSSTVPTDGAYIEIVNLTATLKTRNNSTETSGSSAALSTNTWYGADIEYLTDSSVEFTVFEIAGSVVLNGTISTNVPNSAARVFGCGIVATNSGTSVRELVVVDYIGHGSSRPEFIITP